MVRYLSDVQGGVREVRPHSPRSIHTYIRTERMYRVVAHLETVLIYLLTYLPSFVHSFIQTLIKTCRETLAGAAASQVVKRDVPSAGDPPAPAADGGAAAEVDVLLKEDAKRSRASTLLAGFEGQSS